MKSEERMRRWEGIGRGRTVGRLKASEHEAQGETDVMTMFSTTEGLVLGWKEKFGASHGQHGG